MTDLVDSGDILKQTMFLIDPHETALSLSLKCYEHALTTFSALVENIGKRQISRIPQNLSQRIYYDFNQKPIGNGWISWDSCAHDIERYFLTP